MFAVIKANSIEKEIAILKWHFNFKLKKIIIQLQLTQQISREF